MAGVPSSSSSSCSCLQHVRWRWKILCVVLLLSLLLSLYQSITWYMLQVTVKTPPRSRAVSHIYQVAWNNSYSRNQNPKLQSESHIINHHDSSRTDSSKSEKVSSHIRNVTGSPIGNVTGSKSNSGESEEIVMKSTTSAQLTPETQHQDENVTTTDSDSGNQGEDDGDRKLVLCEETPPNLAERVWVKKEVYSFSVINSLYTPAGPGGHFKPAACRARENLALVVPYRDREKHLKVLLNHLIPLLVKQQAEFTVFVVEQTGNSTFNRAKLLNVGFKEALKAGNFTCFIFHDVDLLPESEKNLYRCGSQPRHLAAANQKYQYKLLYANYSGGVIGMSRSIYEDVNGHSNLYVGWGGEDDDMYYRLTHKGYKLTRYPMKIGRYTALKHRRDRENPVNPIRYRILKNAVERMERDGLNSLNYTVVGREQHRLYTHLLVDLGKSPYKFIPP